MRILCYGVLWDGHLVRISNAVRHSLVGEEIQIYTDVDALVPDMRAFARMTGNRVVDIRHRHSSVVDLEAGPNSVYTASFKGSAETLESWVIILEVLPTNRLHVK